MRSVLVVASLVGAVALGACREDSGSPPIPEVPWRPLVGETLAGWTSTEFGGEGEAYLRDGALVLDVGAPMTGVTWQREFPKSGYEIAFRATREEGYDFFVGLTFPVGETHCSLVLGGWGGATCGLSSLDGLDAARNETSRDVGFENGRPYSVLLRVAEDRVTVRLDGEPFLDVPLAGREVGIRPEVALSRPLGFASFMTRAVLRDGRGRPVPAR